MTRILVSGLANIETNVRIDAFPLRYSGVVYPFFGVTSNVSGVGYNVARALAALGDEVSLLGITGADLAQEQIAAALAAAGIDGAGMLPLATATPQSVILFDPGGRRQIFNDLKDIQELTYPPARFRKAAASVSLAVLGNINYARPLLAEAARLGLPVATDVHDIADLDDAYNRDFMAAAEILFMSDERLPVPPAQWIRDIWQRYGAEIVVVGMGAAGAMLGVRAENSIAQQPAAAIRPVVNTIGAGDALFAAFLHAYAAGEPPAEALRLAQICAGYKIGASGGGTGFLDADGLARWREKIS